VITSSGSKPDIALLCSWRPVVEVDRTFDEKKVSVAAFLALAKAWAPYW